tara:strand:- start:11047 stop:11892 length:846 start_codon:yes stop_codon:yes gene_type:complete
MQISNVENTKKQTNYSIRVRDNLIDLSTPVVMGIINATPDSFFAGSRKESTKNALLTAEQMISDGATIVDIGGYSSRPGAKNITVEEEIKRVVPIIRSIRKHFPDLLISLDTFRSVVAKEGIANGVDIINDISGFEIDPDIVNIVAEFKTPYILMHMKGTPQTMSSKTDYNNLFKEMVSYFTQKIEFLHAQGIHDIIIDPGFGFSKTIEQNYHLLDNLQHFKILDKPILVGLSRKSMIYKKLGINPEESLPETIRLNKIAIEKGASILRVHDVKEAINSLF